MRKLSVLSIFFIIFLLFTITLNSVEGHEISPNFIALKSHINNLKIENNTATCTGSATCLNNYTVKITVYLERYVNNNWISVNNWSGDKDIYSYVNKTSSVSSGYKYRVKSIATVYDKNNNVVENPVLYSDVVDN